MTRKQESERNEARETLRRTLKPGATVYTTVKHVSRSGMQREISVHAVENGEIVWLSGLVAKATGNRLGKRDGIVIGGCGMDMGFAIVHELSYALYPEGFGCIGEGPNHADRCPSNDHSNGDRDYTPHQHKEGGYALRHRWI